MPSPSPIDPAYQRRGRPGRLVRRLKPSISLPVNPSQPEDTNLSSALKIPILPPRALLNDRYDGSTWQKLQVWQQPAAILDDDPGEPSSLPTKGADSELVDIPLSPAMPPSFQLPPTPPPAQPLTPDASSDPSPLGSTPVPIVVKPLTDASPVVRRAPSSPLRRMETRRKRWSPYQKATMPMREELPVAELAKSKSVWRQLDLHQHGDSHAPTNAIGLGLLEAFDDTDVSAARRRLSRRSMDAFVDAEEGEDVTSMIGLGIVGSAAVDHVEDEETMPLLPIEQDDSDSDSDGSDDESDSASEEEVGEAQLDASGEKEGVIVLQLIGGENGSAAAIGGGTRHQRRSLPVSPLGDEVYSDPPSPPVPEIMHDIDYLAFTDDPDSPPKIEIDDTAVHQMETRQTALRTRGSRARRVYPRQMSIDKSAPAYQEALEGLGLAGLSPSFGTPDPSGFPGAFIVSPVLPTSFEFTRTPALSSVLAQSTGRFARVRRNYTTSVASTPAMATLSPATGTECFSSSFLSHSHVSSPHLTGAGDFEPTSAPSTPVPSSSPFPQQPAQVPEVRLSAPLFDTVLATSIVGAVVALGAVGWLAWIMIRGGGKQAKKTATGRRPTDRSSSSDEKDDDAASFGARSPRTQYQIPPLLKTQRRSAAGQLPPATSFERELSVWIEKGEELSKVVDGAGARSSLGSTDSLASSRGSSRRTSTAGTGTIRSTTATSSSVSVTGSSATSLDSAPQIPVPAMLRRATDSDIFFHTPPETPTKRSVGHGLANMRDAPPVPELPRHITVPMPSPALTDTSAHTFGKADATTSFNASLPADINTPPPTPARVVRLARRRATTDGSTQLAASVQALLDQVEKDTDGVSDSPKSRRRSVSSSGTTISRRDSTRKRKKRPVTMPPQQPPSIFVSDHPQDLVPPPEPIIHDNADDSRLSLATIEAMPWLSQSPSVVSGFSTVTLARDDCSILDPDMIRQRRASLEALRAISGTQPPVPRPQDRSLFYRRAQDADHFSDMDDVFSDGSTDPGDLDTDQEELYRSRSRRMLLYSVYEQQGESTSSSHTIKASASEGSDGSTARRDAALSAFPDPPLSPPITPLKSQGSNEAASPVRRGGPAPTSPGRFDPSSTPLPARPPKSLSRPSMAKYSNQSANSSTSSLASGLASSKIPIATRTPLAGCASSTMTGTTRPSFAAELAASVESAAPGYDSDTLRNPTGKGVRSSLIGRVTGLYSTQGSSMESLAEVRTAQVATRRMSGVMLRAKPGLVYRDVREVASALRERGKDESDESSYEL